MIRIRSEAWIFWALLLLILPARWLLSALFAAALHEGAHIAALYLLGGRIRGMDVGISGAVIRAEGISGLREALCALAGPAASLSLVPGIHRFPVLGLCALVQGGFNLLPVYPMDGGRVLRCLLDAAVPSHSDGIRCAVEAVALVLLAAGSLFLSGRSGAGLLAGVVILLALRRKKP